jgi:hypothetical protein
VIVVRGQLSQCAALGVGQSMLTAAKLKLPFWLRPLVSYTMRISETLDLPLRVIMSGGSWSEKRKIAS